MTYGFFIITRRTSTLAKLVLYKKRLKVDSKLQKHFLNLNPGKSHSPYKSKYVIYVKRLTHNLIYQITNETVVSNN